MYGPATIHLRQWSRTRIEACCVNDDVYCQWKQSDWSANRINERLLTWNIDRCWHSRHDRIHQCESVKAFTSAAGSIYFFKKPLRRHRLSDHPEPNGLTMVASL